MGVTPINGEILFVYSGAALQAQVRLRGDLRPFICLLAFGVASLPKQIGGGLHGKKEAARNRGKRDKPEVLVELYGAGINCVHNNRCSCDLG
jgi:hypothetical protein